jgi:formate dehydrogenase iron-sulfur subunit
MLPQPGLRPILPNGIPAPHKNRVLPSLIESVSPFPSDTRLIDGRALRLEEVHWPVILKLILTQLAGGMHVVYGILQSLGASERLPLLSAAAAGVLFLSLNVRLFHTGRPLEAGPAPSAQRRPWIRREVIAFHIYAGLAGLLVWRSGNDFLPLLVIIAGLAAIFCSAMVYADTRRPAWATRIVFTKFFGTSLLLGATGSAVWSGWFAPKSAPLLALAATAIRTFLFGWEWTGLLRARQNPNSPTHHSALVAFGFLYPVLMMRIGLFAGSTVFSVLAIFNVAHHGAIWGTIACFTTVTSQLLERYTFFATSHAPQNLKSEIASQ